MVDVPDDLARYLRSFSIERNIKEKSLILTSDSSIPPQSEEFRGLNVVLERSVDWRSNAFTTYLQALVSKTPAFVDQKGILWVRTNLFTGASQ